jgi:hypothetical protein
MFGVSTLVLHGWHDQPARDAGPRHSPRVGRPTRRGQPFSPQRPSATTGNHHVLRRERHSKPATTSGIATGLPRAEAARRRMPAVRSSVPTLALLFSVHSSRPPVGRLPQEVRRPQGHGDGDPQRRPWPMATQRRPSLAVITEPAASPIPSSAIVHFVSSPIPHHAPIANHRPDRHPAAPDHHQQRDGPPQLVQDDGLEQATSAQRCPPSSRARGPATNTSAAWATRRRLAGATADRRTLLWPLGRGWRRRRRRRARCAASDGRCTT